MTTEIDENFVIHFQRCSIKKQTNKQIVNTDFHHFLEQTHYFLTLLLSSETFVHFVLQHIHFCSRWNLTWARWEKTLGAIWKIIILTNLLFLISLHTDRFQQWFILSMYIFHQAIIQLFISQLKVNPSLYLPEKKYPISLFFNSFHKVGSNFSLWIPH